MFGLELNRKTCLCAIVACIIFSIPVYRSLLQNNHLETQKKLDSDRTSRLPLQINIDDLAKSGTNEKITILAKFILSAQKHVRGSKTSQYLRDAVSVLNSILRDINVDSQKVFERFNMKPLHICSETFKGAGFGFVTDRCDYGVSLSSLVTVIKYIIVKPDDVESKGAELDQFLSSVYETMNNISTLIAVKSAKFPNYLKSKYPLVNIFQLNGKSEGEALNKLMKKVNTPYVLVARNTDTITNDSRLERLIREIESLNVVAAGGSIRDSNGYWTKGCFQIVYRNYTLKYIEGYDESFHECVFCDYIQGPFVTTTSYLKQNMFQEFDENNGLYEDWFLQLFQKGKETVVCPDAMFYVNNQIEILHSNLAKFAQKWDLYKVITPKGIEFTRVCENQKTSSRPSQSLSLCTLQNVSNGIKTIMRICEETGVICELQEGTLLGAVKFGKVLPWEYDFDIKFLATNCSKCKRLESAFKKTPELEVASFSSFCCTNKSNTKDFSSNYQGFYGDFLGTHVLDSDTLIKAGFPPTKILFDGQWVNVQRNPGLSMRNRYGKEIYQHVEHWRFTGNYTKKIFLTCKEQGSHDCLDRYKADGDLPFKQIFP
ncbi:uncharacterized protein LOC128554713 [Mercenaria mercenaria]|uniref:uncharacterized protein LOC128554713 n=1 Tax=Mercenaria mercenaria TaxID=6596 RepID=UPI00234F32A8|nr:uncharacterized protein LOC128554713 [Mercenaria mercenaria]